MTKEAIREQLIGYECQFKQISGHFKSFEVILNYINFLKSEPYLKEIVTPLLSYAEKQLSLVMEAAKDPKKSEILDNLNLDIHIPSTFSNAPIFSKEMETFRKHLENKEALAINTLLPFNLFSLISIANGMQEIKDCQKTGDDKRVKELIEIMQEESFSLMPTHNIKNLPNKVITSAQFLDSCIEMINKHIIDKIDAQDFLDNQKTKAPLNFDKDRSILYIRGQAILITRKTTSPLDHFILEYIFFHETSLDTKTYFADISETLLHDDYDDKKGWNRFRHACDRLNKKISKDTDNRINDFIEYRTGLSGWCKINKKYQ